MNYSGGLSCIDSLHCPPPHSIGPVTAALQSEEPEDKQCLGSGPASEEQGSACTAGSRGLIPGLQARLWLLQSVSVQQEQQWRPDTNQWTHTASAHSSESWSLPVETGLFPCPGTNVLMHLTAALPAPVRAETELFLQKRRPMHQLDDHPSHWPPSACCTV